MALLNRRNFLNLTAATAATTVLPSVTSAFDVGPYSAVHPLLLNQNENALGMSPLAAKAAKAGVDLGHRYPDDYVIALEEKLAAREGLANNEVTIGVGSTGLIETVVRAFAGKGATFLEPGLTYYQMKLLCTDWGLKFASVPMLANFAVDVAAMEAAANKIDGPVVVYLVTPNNPTALLVPSQSITDWIKRAPDNIFFIVDEAYHEYVEDPSYESSAGLVKQGYKNLVVLRTFSKVYAQAGMRVGYGFAHGDTIAMLRLYYSAWNISVSSVVAAAASLDDMAHVQRSLAENKKAKLAMYKVLDKLGLKYIPSETNFILHQVGMKSTDYQQAMLDQYIKVGDDKGAGDAWARLSLGTHAETEYYLERLIQLHRG